MRSGQFTQLWSADAQTVKLSLNLNIYNDPIINNLMECSYTYSIPIHCIWTERKKWNIFMKY